jgi:hypothetical protein
MTKTGKEKTGKIGRKENLVVVSATKKIGKPKVKRDVQVVACPSAFPISDKPKSATFKKRQREFDHDSGSEAHTDHRQRHQEQLPPIPSHEKKYNKILDWHETVKEVRGYGAMAFAGKQKREYEDEQYFKLTGRHKKKQSVPVPIVRGIKKAAAQREAKERKEAREAGIILPKTASSSTTMGNENKDRNDSIIRNYGPAPSVGFMKKGVLRVHDKKREGGGGRR